MEDALLAESSISWEQRGQQWPEDHHAWIVEKAVQEMAPEIIMQAYSGRGSEPHPPMLMLRLALYEDLAGHASPNRWAREAKENEPLRWLIRDIQPSYRACYRFRDRMADVIQQMHDSVIQESLADGLVSKVTTATQDGTTHRACASRHRLVNKQTLEKRKELLEATIGLEQWEPSGALPDHPAWMPSTPRGRLDLMRRMNEAEKVLASRLEENAKRRKERRLKEKHVCVSLSDPRAPISRDKEKVFCPLYTAQYVVDYASGLILGYEVEARATDVGTLLPMIDRVQALVGNTLEKICTDATYCTVIELQGCHERNIDLIALVQENSLTAKKRGEKQVSTSNNRDQFTWVEEESTYRCPAGNLLKHQWSEKATRAGGRSVTMHRYHCGPEHCVGCSLANGCVRDPQKGRTVKRLEGQELLDAQRERMKQEDAKALLRARNAVVERAIGDIKAHRDGRTLHGRGLFRAKAEIGLKVLAQTILTLHRLRKAAASPDGNAT